MTSVLSGTRHRRAADKPWAHQDRLVRTLRPASQQAAPPAAEFVQVRGAGHFIVLERPDVAAKVLNDAMRIASVPKAATCCRSTRIPSDLRSTRNKLRYSYAHP